MKKEVICAFILSSIIIMSIASSLYGPAPGQYSSTPQSALNPALDPPADSYPPESLVSQKSSIVPLDNQGAAISDTVMNRSGSETEPVTKSIYSYVTIEARES